MAADKKMHPSLDIIAIANIISFIPPDDTDTHVAIIGAIPEVLDEVYCHHVTMISDNHGYVDDDGLREYFYTGYDDDKDAKYPRAEYRDVVRVVDPSLTRRLTLPFFMTLVYVYSFLATSCNFVTLTFFIAIMSSFGYGAGLLIHTVLLVAAIVERLAVIYAMHNKVVMDNTFTINEKKMMNAAYDSVVHAVDKWVHPHRHVMYNYYYNGPSGDDLFYG